MRVFVTGGSGFIGSHLVDLLLSNGHEVRNFDIKAPTFRAHDAFWQRGDILDQDALYAAVSSFQPEALVHLAAHADISSEAWSDFASIHEGTENVLAVIDGVQSVRSLVNISTQLVIGPGYQPRSLLDFRPYTLYGEAKAYAEAAVLQWQTDRHWLTVRPATIWGPYHPSFADAIWRYIGKRFYLHPGTREPVLRTYGYVRNTAAQILALLLADKSVTNRQIYYVADEVMDSAIWVDSFAVALTHRKARRIPKVALKAMGRAGDLAKLVGRRFPMDSGRALRMTQTYGVPLERTLALTGPTPVPFEQGVVESVEWLRSLGVA
jgi:nucleoside-diphosphate-sugar epimerase